MFSFFKAFALHLEFFLYLQLVSFWEKQSRIETAKKSRKTPNA